MRHLSPLPTTLQLLCRGLTLNKQSLMSSRPCREGVCHTANPLLQIHLGRRDAPIEPYSYTSREAQQAQRLQHLRTWKATPRSQQFLKPSLCLQASLRAASSAARRAASSSAAFAAAAAAAAAVAAAAPSPPFGGQRPEQCSTNS